MKITNYKIELPVANVMRIALVSDLHDRDSEETLDALQAEGPDLILFAGDLMERHEAGMSPYSVEIMDEWQSITKMRMRLNKIIKRLDGSIFSPKDHVVKWDESHGRRFIREASEIAPLCVGMGNHEWYYLPEDFDLMEACKVRLLDNSHCRIEVAGNPLQIGGLSTRYDLEWLEKFSQDAGTKILICHHPDYYVRYIKGKALDQFDLVVSGHSHGGQWRLFSSGGDKPGIPFFSPGQGFFPKYAYGQYGKHIIGGGVVNTSVIPRFGNPCELVMLEIIPGKI